MVHSMTRFESQVILHLADDPPCFIPRLVSCQRLDVASNIIFRQRQPAVLRPEILCALEAAVTDTPTHVEDLGDCSGIGALGASHDFIISNECAVEEAAARICVHERVEEDGVDFDIRVHIQNSLDFLETPDIAALAESNKCGRVLEFVWLAVLGIRHVLEHADCGLWALELEEEVHHCLAMVFGGFWEGAYEEEVGFPGGFDGGCFPLGMLHKTVYDPLAFVGRVVSDVPVEE